MDTQIGSGNEQHLVLRGVWIGDVHDPSRQFSGVVDSSSHQDVGAGESVHVRFTTGEGRVARTGEHGSYVLTSDRPESGSTSIHLMSFTCHDTSGSGRRGNDDTCEALWRAVACPGG